MSTYNELLNEYKKVFNDKETLRAFLFELCNDHHIDLYMEKDHKALKEIETAFIDGVYRLCQNEPLNYILGYAYFYGYKLIVNNDVLIPRFETEELVGLILSKYDEYFKGQKKQVADVGTGSGAIAIALKKEENNLNMYASDISIKALKVAKKNAFNNNAEITFLSGSLLDPYIENNLKLDILVSNPPYIKQNEILDPSVKEYEPHVALFGGLDGLKFYRLIFEKALKVMNKEGMMFFEIGYDQKEKLILLARSYFKDACIEVFKDINKKDRMMFIKL